MRTLEILLSRRWILKARDKELYYQIKEALSEGEEKKFLMEKNRIQNQSIKNYVKINASTIS